jgi:hypothetical protein
MHAVCKFVFYANINVIWKKNILKEDYKLKQLETFLKNKIGGIFPKLNFNK